MLRAAVREFVREQVAPSVEERDRTGAFPYDAVRGLGQLGLMGVPFPTEYGGGGADMLSLAIVIEELARVDCSLAITVSAHTSLGTMPIHLWGTPEQRDEWLPQLCSGRSLAAYGLSEPEAGSDAGNTRTTAALVDGGWVINGTKAFITNPGTEISGCVTITAVTDAGNGRREISNLIVPTGTPGYDIGPPYRKMGWRSSDTRPLTFVDCRVPEGNLLGRRGGGFRQFMKVLEGGRIGVAAIGVGLAQASLDEAIAYAKERHAFGQPISKFQAIQTKIADISTLVEAARMLTYRAAVKCDRGELFQLEAAQAKLFAGRTAVRAAGEAVQIHGGYGFIEEYPVCRFYRDAKILTIGEGTDEVLQMLIAKQLGC
jgi:short/branched chain acyl-CoA dehydrogenase